VLSTSLRSLLNAVRLILAAAFVFVGLAGAAGLADAVGLEGIAMLVVLVPVWLAVVAAAYGLFNRPEDRHFLGDRDLAPDAEVERLRALGSLVEREFHVGRVFEVEDTGEGSQYVCELDDGACLLLRGQYLWDYVNPWQWPWRPKVSRFPSTRFVLYQNPWGAVVHLVCRGEQLAPEGVAPPFTIDEFLEQELFDGEVTRVEQPYEELKRLLFRERPIRAPED
jgi:hypothetical protein